LKTNRLIKYNIYDKLIFFCHKYLNWLLEYALVTILTMKIKYVDISDK